MKIAFPSLLLVAVFLIVSCSTLIAANPFQAAFDKILAEDNKVFKHKSGMLVKVLKKGGDAAAKAPTLNDKCQTHYAGFLLNQDGTDGKKFDSSYDRGQPLALAPSGVIQGWKTIMQEMGEGDKLKIWLPPSLGYGASGAGGVIGPNAALVFTLEIIKVQGTGVSAEVAHSQWKTNVGKEWDEIEASE